MTHYSIEPRTRKYIKRYKLLSFGRDLRKKYGRKLLDAATKITPDALKLAAKFATK